MRTKGKCKHFNGTINKTCLAGVRYDDMMPLPCVHHERPGRRVCDLREEPTNDEIAKDAAAMDSYGARHRKVGTAIIELKAKYKGKSWQGVIECPVCGGLLHVSHAAYNGHVHGRCETMGCVDWMEGECKRGPRIKYCTLVKACDSEKVFQKHYPRMNRNWQARITVIPCKHDPPCRDFADGELKALLLRFWRPIDTGEPNQ